MAIKHTLNECDYCKRMEMCNFAGIPHSWIVVSSEKNCWNFCSWKCAAKHAKSQPEWQPEVPNTFYDPRQTNPYEPEHQH